MRRGTVTGAKLAHHQIHSVMIIKMIGDIVKNIKSGIDRNLVALNALPMNGARSKK